MLGQPLPASGHYWLHLVASRAAWQLLLHLPLWIRNAVDCYFLTLKVRAEVAVKDFTVTSKPACYLSTS